MQLRYVYSSTPIATNINLTPKQCVFDSDPNNSTKTNPNCQDVVLPAAELQQDGLAETSGSNAAHGGFAWEVGLYMSLLLFNLLIIHVRLTLPPYTGGVLIRDVVLWSDVPTSSVRCTTVLGENTRLYRYRH